MTDSEAALRDKVRRGAPRPREAQHGDWSRARLRAMDEKFCKRVKRAVRDGREHMPGGTVK
jgi:hypothetical protein